MFTNFSLNIYVSVINSPNLVHTVLENSSEILLTHKYISDVSARCLIWINIDINLKFISFDFEE